MKVLMLTWEFPPFIVGGLGMACYGIAKSLLRQGVEIYLVLPTEKKVYFHLMREGDTDALPPVFLQAGAEEQYRLRGFESVEERLAFLGVGVRPEVYAAPSEAGLRQALFEQQIRAAGESDRRLMEKIESSLEGDGDTFQRVRGYVTSAKEYAQGIDFDLIHVHDWLTYPAGVFLKSVTGKPLVAHIHATEFDRAGGPGNGRIHDIEYSGLALADRVIAVSRYTASLIIQRYQVDPAKVRVVYNAYSIEKAQRERKRLFKGPVVLFLGRITLQKGPDYFLEVAKRVVEEIPDVRFIMAGVGDMERQLIHKSAYYQLHTRFLFTGFLRRKDVDRILSSSDIFILPSVSEPFGIAPLEAMSYGVAAIVSKQSGVSEVVENAFKIDFWDINMMVGIIVDLLKNPEKLKNAGQAGAREVEKIGWDQAGASLKEIYRELVC